MRLIFTCLYIDLEGGTRKILINQGHLTEHGDSPNIVPKLHNINLPSLVAK